jgi:Ca-activated chloride channel family protein
MRRWRRVAAYGFVAAATLGWLDPSAGPRTAARLYAEGKFDDAATAYNQALIDAPDSALLHFNLGDAEYRRQKYEEALRAFGQVPGDAAAQYNQGNTLFRMGEQAADGKPQEALAKWAEALVAYRRAIASDPQDEDAKFNYEWVSRKIEELRKKQEQQEQQQEQNQDQQPQDQQGQDQQQEQPPDPQAGEDAPQDEPQEDQAGAGEPQAQPDEAGEGQADAQAGTPEPAEGQLTREEATALLDGERHEELQPEDVIRRQLGTGEAPVQDW